MSVCVRYTHHLSRFAWLTVISRIHPRHGAAQEVVTLGHMVGVVLHNNNNKNNTDFDWNLDCVLSVSVYIYIYTHKYRDRQRDK